MNNMKIDKQNGNVAIDKLDSNNVNKVCGIYKIGNSKYFYIGSYCNISNTIHGKQKTAGGFIWKI